ncbi:MAG: hypothetical protein V1742_01185 [Pseudomonadota bacterium]
MIYEMPSCGGCRTCEMACSFHHLGKFNPSVSSIKIIDKEDTSGYVVMILEQSERRGLACDGCPGLAEPLCLEYCREKDELESILKQLARLEKSTARTGGARFQDRDQV